MEFLDNLVDWFSSFTSWIERSITRIFGASNERTIQKIGFARDKEGNDLIVSGSVIDRINQLEPEMEKLTEGELKQSAEKFRKRLADGETLDDLLPEAYAAVRESSRRFLKMRHYDVQMVGGYFLHQGMIAEMVTGEGKTLVSTLPAFLNALSGHVHIITVNDYLALRDMEWMGPVHMGLGLTVGAIQANMDPPQRHKPYACDITYGTNNEFGFDYLRDNMKPTRELQVQGDLNFAIVDEIDNILIDEARTPLIISGPAHDDVTKYSKADRIVRQLKRDVDFEVKEKEHTCHLTEEGIRHAEELAGVESFYTVGNMEWPHLIDNSLKAYHLYKRDVNYVVENGNVVIVDEFTGRKMEGRQWSDGLHQAVEAKEGVTVKKETQTLATITLQNYFKLYKKLAGMTGTAMTEAAEFWKIYKLDVISVPTNMPLRRTNYTDVIFRTEKEKWDAVVNEIRDVHKTGRPILVGTVSIEKSELLSGKLNKFGIKHNVLNAKYHEREAEIIAQAGRERAVTIATNMAGRGTDIILGGNPEHMAWDELKNKYESRLDVTKAEWDETTNKIAEQEGMMAEGRHVAETGGLHVIGTERHDARRIDLQLRGRCGRQGDPGSSRFFLSLEDDLMRIFAGEWVKNMLTRLGMQEGEAIESRMVSKRIEAAQKKVEERHFDTRKHLLEYDEVMDEQRKRVYSYRQQILDGKECRGLILNMVGDQIEQGTAHYLDSDYRWETIVESTAHELQLELDVGRIRGMNRDQLELYLKDESRGQASEQLKEQIDENLPEDAEDTSDWNWLALSKWANSKWGLNTNDRELKKIGREGLFDSLYQRADEAIDRYDFEVLEAFLADDFGRRSLCGWLFQQFALETDPDDFDVSEIPAAADLIRQKIEDQYHEKEVLFPVAVGMTNFLGDRGSSDKSNREGLLRWAGDRFEKDFVADGLQRKSYADIEKALIESSRQFFTNGETAFGQLKELVDDIFGEEGGFQAHAGNGEEHPKNKELSQLADRANEVFHSTLSPDDFRPFTRDDVLEKLSIEFHKRYRPELYQAERSLILEVLDSSWKDHLYYMDHVRSGIGLVSYAQKDPKTEYKREGRKAFRSMWNRVDEQVTSAIFRMERESPAFVGSLWEITATTHEDVTSEAHFDAGDGQPGQSMDVIEPIRNLQPKVGRNDPCPCNSGKKYKKCCGKA
ncbi:MAG: preprotein translocase subunit SecA [Planctomycetes bacterium]|nr:preprotein translocase subunit SecA [Planctomycetota bacterium]